MWNLFGLHSVYGKSTVLFFLSIINYLLQFVFSSYLTHHLTPAYYGTFFLALSLLAILANIALFGTQTIAVKFMPRYLFLDNPEELDSFLGWVFKILSVSFVVCFCVALTLASLMIILHAIGNKHLDSYSLYMFMLWVTPFVALMTLVQNFILSKNHPLVNYLMQNDLVFLVQITLFYIVISLLQIQLNNVNITLTLILSYFLLIIVAAVYIRRHDKKLFASIMRDAIRRPTLIDPEWKKMAIKVVLSGIIYNINLSMDLFILKSITPFPAQVGFYSAAWVICSIFPLIPQSITTLILPKIDMYTRTNANLSLHEFQDIINKMNIVILAILIPLTIAIIIFGKDILSLFGTQYIVAYPILVVCTIASLIGGLSMPAAYLLLYSSNVNVLLAIDVLQFFLILILGIILTLLYYAIGVIIAWLIVQTITSLFLVYYARKKTGLKSTLAF